MDQDLQLVKMDNRLGGMMFHDDDSSLNVTFNQEGFKVTTTPSSSSHVTNDHVAGSIGGGGRRRGVPLAVAHANNGATTAADVADNNAGFCFSSEDRRDTSDSQCPRSRPCPSSSSSPSAVYCHPFMMPARATMTPASGDVTSDGILLPFLSAINNNNNNNNNNVGPTMMKSTQKRNWLSSSTSSSSLGSGPTSRCSSTNDILNNVTSIIDAACAASTATTTAAAATATATSSMMMKMDATNSLADTTETDTTGAATLTTTIPHVADPFFDVDDGQQDQQKEQEHFNQKFMSLLEPTPIASQGVHVAPKHSIQFTAYDDDDKVSSGNATTSTDVPGGTSMDSTKHHHHRQHDDMSLFIDMFSSSTLTATKPSSSSLKKRTRKDETPHTLAAQDSLSSCSTAVTTGDVNDIRKKNSSTTNKKQRRMKGTGLSKQEQELVVKENQRHYSMANRNGSGGTNPITGTGFLMPANHSAAMAATTVAAQQQPHPQQQDPRQMMMMMMMQQQHHHHQLHPQRFRQYQEEQWSDRLQDMLEFKRIHGHCNVPNIFPLNPHLAQWVKRQRYQHKLKQEGRHSTLTDERQVILNQIGFIWDSHNSSWLERYKELEEFAKVHGHANVPTNYEHNKQLSVWVKCQRRQYKLHRRGTGKSNMTPERIDKLEKIGFVWNPRGLKDF